jgi:uncharacterized protein with von Willebrand factor type A (vWA) domain
MIPNTIEELDAYEAIVLSDVARNNLTDPQMKISQHMCGILVRLYPGRRREQLRRRRLFKNGNRRGAPCHVETKKEKPDSVAMIVVLDKSGSMGGQKIEMTKEAAKAPLALLKDTDSFGVVAFDYNFYWPVKFQPVSNRSAITQAISTIIAGGETNIYPRYARHTSNLPARRLK